MLSFIIRRLLIAIPLVLLSSVLVFLLVANSGDPLAELKGRNPPVPPQVIEAREHDARPRQAAADPLRDLAGQLRPGGHGQVDPRGRGPAAAVAAAQGDAADGDPGLDPGHHPGHRGRGAVGGEAVHPDRLHLHLPRVPVPVHAGVLVSGAAQGVRRDPAQQAVRGTGGVHGRGRDAQPDRQLRDPDGRLRRPPDPADRRPGPDQLRRLVALPAGHHAGRARLRLHPAGQGQGPVAIAGDDPPRPPQRPDPAGHRGRDRHRGGVRRGDHHRAGVLLAGHGRAARPGGRRPATSTSCWPG